MARKHKPDKKDTPNSKQSPKRREREPWTPWGRWAKARRERIERKRREREERRQRRIRARQARRMRRRRLIARGVVFVGLGVLACLIGLLTFVLLGPPYPWEALGDASAVLAVSHSLDKHRARWDSLAVHHYTVEVMYTDGQTRCGPAQIEVRGRRVVDYPKPDETHWFPAKTCDALLESLTVEGAFDWLERQISAIKPGRSYLRAEFDPSFGYPTYFEVGVYRAPTPGCCWNITWSGLRPIDD